MKKKNILITGANGFIGKNLVSYLSHQSELKIITFVKNDNITYLKKKIRESDLIIHLASEIRSEKKELFYETNVNLLSIIIDEIKKTKRNIPIIFTSSILTNTKSDYGQTKKIAENLLKKFYKSTNNTVVIYSLANVFGKWAKPNYNSVVATFCYNKIRNIPLRIDNPEKELNLIFIDDLITDIKNVILKEQTGFKKINLKDSYKTTLKELENKITYFNNSRMNLTLEGVGKNFERKLYSTFISYLEPENFAYKIEKFNDKRGVFAELFKTESCGQVSYFTISNKLTRGSHFHHIKTEKFFVVYGSVLFKFKNIVTNKIIELKVSQNDFKIIDSPPGWAHEIINIGSDSAIIILWSNENFDPNNPDCIKSSI